MEQFTTDIAESDLILHPPADLESLVKLYNTTLQSLLDKHAPQITKTRRRHLMPWYTPALRAFKLVCRKAERAWLKSRNAIDWKHFRETLSDYHSKITAAKQEHYSTQITNSMGNSKKLWQTVNSLLHRCRPSALPTSPAPGTHLPTAFSNFFNEKITKLRLNIQSSINTTISPHQPVPPLSPAAFSQFRAVT